MKVLIVNTYSHIGSTGKITYNLYNFLRENGHDVLLCTRGYPEEQLTDERVVRLNSKFRYWAANVFVGFWGDETIAYPVETKRLKSIIDDFKPDLVQLYNVHDYYVNHIELITYLKEKNIPTVYSMLDEYAYMGKCRFSLECNKFQDECIDCQTRKRKHVLADYIFDWSGRTQKRKEEAYQGFDNLHFTGPRWTIDRAKTSSLLKDKNILELEEPVNYDDTFYPRDASVLRERLKIPKGVKIILMVGKASTERKGGKYFVELARKFENDSNYVFVFVGYDRSDWDIPKNMITIGFVNNQDELAEYYSLPDLFVCTSYGDSTPAACLDAMGCGSPITGFNIVGIPYCAEEPYGVFVTPFDLDALAKVVIDAPFKTDEIIKKVRNYAYQRFSTHEVFKKQLNIYKTILKGDKKMIPFNKPYCSGRELKYMEEVCHSTTMSGNGDFTKKCHAFFEKKYGFKKVLLCTSGTDALEMCAMLCDLKPGDEVIVPSYTFVSTALAFLREGAKVVFADSGKDNPNITLDDIVPLVTPKTKVIAVVHYAGVACDMDAIMQFANERNILVVEDAAHSIDSFYKDKPLGGIGHLGAFSFHETKNISSGEGGMLVVNDERFIRRAEIIWEKGTNRAEFYRGMVNKYGWCDMGSSFLPSEFNAAYLWAQLEQMDDIQGKRLAIWNTYDKVLRGKLNNGIMLPELPDYATNNAHMYYLLCPSLEYRTAFMNYLKENGVVPTFHYLPLHSSAYYKDKHDGRELPNCDRYGDTLVRLPLYYELSLEDAERIAELTTNYQ